MKYLRIIMLVIVLVFFSLLAFNYKIFTIPADISIFGITTFSLPISLVFFLFFLLLLIAILMWLGVKNLNISKKRSALDKENSNLKEKLLEERETTISDLENKFSALMKDQKNEIRAENKKILSLLENDFAVIKQKLDTLSNK